MYIFSNIIDIGGVCLGGGGQCFERLLGVQVKN